MSTEELLKYLMTPAVQVALIIGVAEVVKRLGLFDKKYIPILDICLGLLSGIGVYTLSFGYKWIEGIVIGIALGLSACGLFSGIKNVFEKKNV